MSARSYSRGWPVEFVDGQWRYVDTLRPLDPMRPCRKCGRAPLASGEDACLGHVDGATSACCGHGAEEPFEVQGQQSYQDAAEDLCQKIKSALGRGDEAEAHRLLQSCAFALICIELDVDPATAEARLREQVRAGG